MKKLSGFYQKNKKIITGVLFPLILFLYPLMKINQGIDVSDSTYSMGNYLYFPELEGTWVISTYLSNVLGFFFTKLPFGKTLLGFNLYSGLLVSGLVLIVYDLLRRWMPDWIVFLGEFVAVGFLWIPTGILYNYLTYFLFTLAALFLYRGLTDEGNGYLLLAGILLGANVFVRIPNLAEMALILVVWYDSYLKKKEQKTGKNFWQCYFGKTTGVCIGGYLLGLLVPLCCVLLQYGSSGFLQMITGLSSIQGSDNSYSLFSMVGAVITAYGRSGKWLLLLLIGMVLGLALFAIANGRFMKSKKVIYIVGLLLLLRFYWGRGMFSFRYYEDYTAMYEWGMLGLFLSFWACLYLLTGKDVSSHERLFGMLSLVFLLITPLGSNNYTYQNLNNLFIVAAVTGYAVTKWLRRKRTEKVKGSSFVFHSSLFLVLGMICIQTIGFHSQFVFRDGMDGSKRTVCMKENSVVNHMFTTEKNAKNLGGIIAYFESEKDLADTCIYAGDCPGLTFLLQKPSALSTSWLDLDSEPVAKIEKDIESLQGFPVVIWRQTEVRSKTFAEKWKLIENFMHQHSYQSVFQNEEYQVFAVEKGAK